MTMDAIFNYDERVILNMFATPNKSDLQISLMRSQQYADDDMIVTLEELLIKIEDMDESDYELLFLTVLGKDYEPNVDAEEIEIPEEAYDFGYLLSQDELEQLTALILKHYAQLAQKLQGEDQSLITALTGALNNAVSGNESTVLINAIREIFDLYDQVLQVKQDGISQLIAEIDRLYAKFTTASQEKDKQVIMTLSGGQGKRFSLGGLK